MTKLRGTVVLVLAAISVLVGCGGGDQQKVAVEDEAVAEGEGNPLMAPVDYLGAVNQAQKSSANKLALVGLQQAIQQFKVMEDRLPKNLQEVISNGYIARLPDAPKGMILAFNPQTGEVVFLPNPDADAGGR